MRPIRLSFMWVLLLAGTMAQAADIEAGKVRAEAVCAACHGANGVSVSDAIPNLAAQKAVYLETQLKALKDASRKSQVMNAIASQLSATEIADLAAYFAAQPGASATAKSSFLPELVKTGVSFPADHRRTLTKYHTINFPATRQVRYYYANKTALQSAQRSESLPDGSYLFVEVHSARLDAEKKPVVGGDGFFEADQLLFYTAMAREAGWGSAFPQMLRNEDWNYAAFSAAGQPRAANQAECLACHKPLDKTSFTFTLDQLKSGPKSP
jgi:cytochrome c553